MLFILIGVVLIGIAWACLPGDDDDNNFGSPLPETGVNVKR